MTSVKLHPAQSKVVKHLFDPLDPNSEDWRMRFTVTAGSRGFGKSFVAGAVTALGTSELTRLDASIPDKNISIFCGSHTQVVDVYFPLLAYTYGLESRSEKNSRSEGRFLFGNGTEIRCLSTESIERVRGSGNYIIIADELPTWRVPGSSIKDAWESVLEPTIITRWSADQAKRRGAPSPGRAFLPSTPMGKDFFYDLAQRQYLDPRWKTFQFTYHDSPLLSASEIELAKRHMDPIKFAREYLASFEESGLNVFYAFSRERNVREDLPYFEKGETVHAAIDFNIMLNATSFHAIRGGQLQCLDEHQGSANTEELIRDIKKKFPNNPIACYPDPAGKQRRTSAPIGQTDFSLLKAAGFQVYSRSNHPAIVDSVAAVNRKLLNAKEEVDFLIHPRCAGVIRSLERTTWLESRPETATIDKSQNIEHYSDGVRYLIEYLWPVTFNRPMVASGLASSFQF